MTVKVPVKAKQDMLKTFSIDFNSEQDGMRYKGNFTVKKLSIADLGALGVRKAQLNGGMHYNEDTPGRGVDENTDSFNNMIAHLEIAIKEHPPWWDLTQITDTELLGEVFKEVYEFEQTFLLRKSANKKSGSTSNGSGAGAVPQTDAPGSLSQVVGEEVSSALEP